MFVYIVQIETTQLETNKSDRNHIVRTLGAFKDIDDSRMFINRQAQKLRKVLTNTKSCYSGIVREIYECRDDETIDRYYIEMLEVK